MQTVFTIVMTLFSGVPRLMGHWCSATPRFADTFGSLPGLWKIPHPRCMVSWVPSDQTEHSVARFLGASIVGRSMPGSATSTVSGLPSLLHSSHAPDASMPVLPQMDSVCVDSV